MFNIGRPYPHQQVGAAKKLSAPLDGADKKLSAPTLLHTWATQPKCQRLEGRSRGPKSLQGEVWALVLLVLNFLVPITSDS